MGKECTITLTENEVGQVLDGERDFDDAMTVEEYVVPVTVHPAGTITDEAGNQFGPLLK